VTTNTICLKVELSLEVLNGFLFALNSKFLSCKKSHPNHKPRLLWISQGRYFLWNFELTKLFVREIGNDIIAKDIRLNIYRPE
jgi:hypothetical protein